MLTVGHILAHLDEMPNNLPTLFHFPLMAPTLSGTVTRFNNKQFQFVSRVLNSKALVKSVLKDLNPYAFPPTAIMWRVIEKLTFNKIPQKNLENHNVHAWLLEIQPLRNTNSPRQ